jgi:tetratricopeptide (TPR) repeat protein
MIRKKLCLAAVGLPLLFAGCAGEEDMNAKMVQAADQAEKGKWEAAGKTAEAVAKAKPKEVAPVLLQALAYEQQGEYDKALDLARQGAEMASGDFTVQYTYGRLTAKDPARRSEAFSILERALELNPGDQNTLILLCNIGSEIEHPKVIKYLNELRKNKDFAQSPVLLYQIGCYNVRAGKTNHAQVWLRRAARDASKSKNWDLLLNCARTLDRSGAVNQKTGKKEALEWYGKYRALSGNRGAEYKEVNARIAQLQTTKKQPAKNSRTKGRSR